jgi:Na+/melibiose symporter-like transporter
MEPEMTAEKQIMTDANNEPDPSSETARAVRRGVQAGYLMALQNIAGAALVYFSGYGVDVQAGDDRTIMAAATLLMAFVAAALAYWFSRKHTIVVPAVLLVWLFVEAAAKLLDRGPSALSVVIFGLIGFGLISGLRGAWELRKANI